MSETVIHSEGHGDDVGEKVVDSVIDHAHEIGEHAARLDALETAQEGLKTVVDGVKGTAEYAHQRIDNLLTQPAQPVADVADVADAVVDKLKDAADDAVDDVEPAVVEAPKEVENEAEKDTKDTGRGIMSFLRGLNIH